MSNLTAKDITVEILGKPYKIKCPEDLIYNLQKAAKYLEESMIKVQQSGVISPDKMAVITALNVINQLFKLETSQLEQAQNFSKRVLDLQSKVDKVLLSSDQLELSSAE